MLNQSPGHKVFGIKLSAAKRYLSRGLPEPALTILINLLNMYPDNLLVSDIIKEIPPSQKTNSIILPEIFKLHGISETDIENILAKKPLYISKLIPKSSGEKRRLDIPNPDLKFLQKLILQLLLSRIKLSPFATAFRQGFSVHVNAVIHLYPQQIITVDLEDFFPSITFQRVRGFFRGIGVDKELSKLLSKITTYRNRLPQGAPTSPLIANAIAFNLDNRIGNLAKAEKLAYTRYADDIVLSSSNRKISHLLPLMREIIEEEGFFVSEQKVRIVSRTRQQKVTGVVINETLSLPRNLRRNLRAKIHSFRNKVSGGKTARNTAVSQLKKLRGEAAWIYMINRQQGEKLLKQIEECENILPEFCAEIVSLPRMLPQNFG
ncbi:MAG: reverse transcriptase domain-containing protein [Planctomycetota bacterium]